MPISDRDYTQWKRSKRYKQWVRSGHPLLQYCPLCNKESLFWNWRNETYECLNLECKGQGRSTSSVYRPHGSGVAGRSQHGGDVPDGTISHPVRGEKKPLSVKLPDWMISLLLVTALSIVGLGVSLYAGSYLPLWLLLGFSFFYSIEKWFYHLTRRHKGLGKLYRLLLNLSMLSLLSLLIWSGVKLFSQQFLHSPVAGTLIFLAEFAFFVWMARVVSRNSWRWPSMKLTVFSLLVVGIICAFAGVQPMSHYKDSIVTRFETYRAEQEIRREEQKRMPEETATAPTETLSIEEVEREAFNLINQERERAGLVPTVWDDTLYGLSRSHTEDMANSGTLFHAPMGASYAENAWGAPWGGIRRQNLASTMVSSWMSSPLHRAWILHVPLKTSVVSMVDDDRGQYASWTFWMREAGQGPPLVQKAYNIWMSETGGSIPWLTWLYDTKGYPSNTDWLTP